MSTNAPVLDKYFHIIQGKERLSSFESSPGKRGFFCKECGSHIYAKKENIPAIVLRIGCLDDDGTIPKPEAHIWRSDAATWYDPQSEIKELPEGRRSE